MLIEADKKDYSRAFDKHYKAYCAWENTGHDDSKSMILFYCVECGLKYLLMDKLRILKVSNATEEIQDKLHSHDLRALLKELRMNSNKYKFTDFKTIHDSTVSLKQYHEVRRYCIPPKKNFYSTIRQYDANLYEIAKWINEQRWETR